MKKQFPNSKSNFPAVTGLPGSKRFHISFKPSLAILAALWIAVSGCDQSASLTKRPITDEYAGTTVADTYQAKSLVMKRLTNPPLAGQRAPETDFFDAGTGESVTLTELIGEKPVVLIFGSATCSTLNFSNDEIEKLANRFSDFVDFHFVYIREAHPAGGFNLPLVGSHVGLTIPEIEDAPTLERRRKDALAFAERVGFSFSILTDELNDSAAIRWGGWPLRIFVIDRDGTVLYAGGQGPWYFKPSESYSHVSPTPELDSELRMHPFDQDSLEKFLASRFGSR